MHPIEAKYRARTPKSAAVAARAERLLPGGDVRAASYHAPYSVVIDRGQGARLHDVDGNDYLDFINNYTVLVHGHAYPPVTEAIHRAVDKGTCWPAKAMDQLELAEMVVDRVASIEQVRFANSATEAVLQAVVAARAYTGRKRILCARYGFHGFALDAKNPTSKPDLLDTELADFNDAASFERVLEEQGSQIAAVVLEPILGAGGIVAGTPEFFARVHAAARKAGALLVLDEATVFRVATGGAQQLLGVDPDLTVLGKVVGGGTPAGAVGGKREIMRMFDPRSGKVFISGTFAGNPVTMAAGVAMLRDLTAERIARQEAQLAMLEDGLKKLAARHRLPFSTRRFRSLMNIYFSETPPPVNQLRQDVEMATAFQLACMANGIFMVVRLVLNCSTVMTDADIREALQRFDAALADVAGTVR